MKMATPEEQAEIRGRAEVIAQLLLGDGFWSTTTSAERNSDLTARLQSVAAQCDDEAIIHFFRHPDSSYEVRVYFK